MVQLILISLWKCSINFSEKCLKVWIWNLLPGQNHTLVSKLLWSMFREFVLTKELNWSVWNFIELFRTSWNYFKTELTYLNYFYVFWTIFMYFELFRTVLTYFELFLFILIYLELFWTALNTLNFVSIIKESSAFFTIINFNCELMLWDLNVLHTTINFYMNILTLWMFYFNH